MDFADLLESVAPANSVATSHGLDLARKIWVVAKSYMEHAVRETVRLAARRPVLHIYGSDITPMLHKNRTTVSVSGRSERRESSVPCEWLLHRSYYLWKDSRGEIVVRNWFEGPVLMASKKAWFIFAAACRFPMLHRLHREGLSISWHVFDRGEKSAVCRLLRRRHLHDHSQVSCLVDQQKAILHDWVVDSACADHDTQNALLHGCAFLHENTAVLYKNLFKAIRSARDFLTKLMITLPEWVQRLQIEEQAFDYDVALRCWLALGAKEHVAMALAAINLRWENNALRCGVKVLEQPDPYGHVGDLILSAYRLSTFTTSRFLSCGRACAGVAMGLLVGLDQHMAFTRGHKKTKSDYYGNCWDLFEVEERMFVCKTALAAQTTDKLHKLLLKDDRMAKGPGKFVESVQSQLLFLNRQVPERLYKLLAEHIPDCSAVKLESDTLRAAYHAASFADRRIFAELRKPMFQLMTGDTRQKLEALAQDGHPKPSDDVLWKAQSLLRLGTPIQVLLDAFDVLKEAPWSILRWEQMHGQAAKQHQAHKGFSPSSHATKTAIHTLLPMSRAASANQHRSMDEVRLASVKRKQPEKSSGQGAFLGDSCRTALSRHTSAPPLKRRSIVMNIVQGHAAEFHKLPAELQDKYSRDAKATTLRKAADHRVRKHALEDQVKSAAEKKAQELCTASCLRAARFGWSEDDLACLTRSFYGPDFRQAVVDAAAAAELQGPLEKPPLKLRQAMKEADDGSWEEEVPFLPDWVAGVCRQRIACSGVAFRFGCSADSPTFMLGHASKSPMWVAFYHLRQRRPEGAASSSGDVGVLGLPARQPHRHLWTVEHHEFFFEDSCRLRAPPSDVIPGCRFESGFIVFSDTEAIPYDTWIESLPPVPKVKRDKKKDKDEKDDTLMARHDPRRLAAVHGLVSAGKGELRWHIL